MKVVGIIGDPISHSLSPAMHNAVFRKMRLPFLYLPFRVRPTELPSFVKRVKKGRQLTGFNVTLPHKVLLLKHLDWVAPEARAIGAVNTVVLKNGRLHGYNTDAEGYLLSLRREAGISPRGKKIVVLGAGGAARAILYALLRGGASHIYVCNRTVSRANRLVKDLRRKNRSAGLRALPLKRETLKEIFPETDLLINATSVGLKGKRFKGLPLSLLRRKAVISDLVYHPLITPLLRTAKQRGHKIHPGFGMLLYQGALSFRLWTGKKPDLQVMRKALLDALK